MMNRINYDSQLDSLIGKIKEKGDKPSLLLHSCCAPCSSACLMRVKDYFDVTVFFYNPNLDSDAEYVKRAGEQVRLCEYYGIKYVVSDYDSKSFYSAVKGLESVREGGERCFKCFELRLKKSALTARELHCDYFATTLTLSPLKNADKINEIGFETEKEIGVKYLPTDFKKKGGYQLSVELSKEHNLYRQNYCGCIYSKSERGIK